jgi:hypothetical protein
MVNSPYIEACCRLNERFPALRRLWLYLWRRAIASMLACSRSSRPSYCARPDRPACSGYVGNRAASRSVQTAN